MELGVGGATRVTPPQVLPRPIVQIALWSTWTEVIIEEEKQETKFLDICFVCF